MKRRIHDACVTDDYARRASRKRRERITEARQTALWTACEQGDQQTAAELLASGAFARALTMADVRCTLEYDNEAIAQLFIARVVRNTEPGAAMAESFIALKWAAALKQCFDKALFTPSAYLMNEVLLWQATTSNAVNCVRVLIEANAWLDYGRGRCTYTPRAQALLDCSYGTELMLAETYHAPLVWGASDPEAASLFDLVEKAMTPVRRDDVIVRLLACKASADVEVQQHMMSWVVASRTYLSDEIVMAMVGMKVDIGGEALLQIVDTQYGRKPPVGAGPIELLLKHKADPTQRMDHSQKTVLHICPPDVVRPLLMAKADACARDRRRCTPLHEHTAPVAVRLLLDAKADIDAQDENGRTALHVRAGPSDDDFDHHAPFTAALEPDDWIAAAKILVRAKADVDVQDKDGWTALCHRQMDVRHYERFGSEEYVDKQSLATCRGIVHVLLEAKAYT
jgi:hypothetical protein